MEQDSELEKITGLQMEDTVVQPTKEGLAHVAISNMTGYSSFVRAGAVIRKVVGVEVVEKDKPMPHDLTFTSTPT